MRNKGPLQLHRNNRGAYRQGIDEAGEGAASARVSFAFGLRSSKEGKPKPGASWKSSSALARIAV